MFTPPKATQPPKIQRKSVKSWVGGTITAFDDGRTPENGLLDAGNVLLDQDSIVTPRPSLTKYGPQPIGTVLGEIFEFRAFVGTTPTNWLICLQNVSGTTNAYIAKGTDTTWTLCPGFNFNNTAPARFMMLANKVLIMNGADFMPVMDIATSTVVPYTLLTTPAAPTLDTLTGLTGTTLTVYYAITWNSSVGETDGSPVLSQAISTDRDLWNPATQSVKIKWSTPPTGTKSTNVYMGVSTNGSTPQMYLIAQGIAPGTLSFVDDGSRAQNLQVPLPTFNSTQGFRVSRGIDINGRAWLVGDTDNPFYVRYGGDYGHELDFSPANGGGFTSIGNGTKELPVKVMPFRDGKGTSQITVLCQGTNGAGKRYILTPDTVTYGGQSFPFYDVTEDNGQDGTDSPDGVILYNDSLWYPSRDGFKTTGTKPQLQNILSTNRISNTIQSDIKTLNTSAMGGCIGLGFEGRLYWAVPVGSTSNNEIWVLDLDRSGAWMKPWGISADWMTLYNDNSGVSHFLILSNNNIYELNSITKTSDDGVAFPTYGNSGQIPFSDDTRDWGRLIQVTFVVLRPQGQMNFTVSCMTDDGVVTFSGGEKYGTSSSAAGWSEAGWGSYGWSNFQAVSTTQNDPVQEFVVPVDEDAQWFTYGWSTTDTGVSYAISDVVGEYVDIGVRDIT